mmetsp:Transcript_4601/g.13905  ORF Transcript_4601/g.13905 Transcript_4601/m.13905 type:complete len:259 (-) Transcript_4601:1451-2227(-)
MTSSSAYGVPLARWSPSETRKRTSLPFTVDNSVVGSYSRGNMHVMPSSTISIPPTSSRMYVTWDLSSKRTMLPPSLSACTVPVTDDSFKLTRKTAGAALESCMTYFVSSYMSSSEVSMRVSRSGGGCPRSSASRVFLSSASKKDLAQHRAPQMTASWGSGFLRSMRSAIRRSSHVVSIRFCWKSSSSSRRTRYSTVVLMSPRMERSLSVSTMALLALSLSSPHAKRCPNCESENSCTPPVEPTEKYPQTLGVFRKVSS